MASFKRKINNEGEFCVEGSDELVSKAIDKEYNNQMVQNVLKVIGTPVAMAVVYGIRAMTNNPAVENGRSMEMLECRTEDIFRRDYRA